MDYYITRGHFRGWPWSLSLFGYPMSLQGFVHHPADPYYLELSCIHWGWGGVAQIIPGYFSWIGENVESFLFLKKREAWSCVGEEMNDQNSTDGGIFEPLRNTAFNSMEDGFFFLSLSLLLLAKTPQDFGNAPIGWMGTDSMKGVNQTVGLIPLFSYLFFFKKEPLKLDSFVLPSEQDSADVNRATCFHVNGRKIVCQESCHNELFVMWLNPRSPFVERHVKSLGKGGPEQNL